MEFIGHHISDKSELRIRMPKFGNIRNIQNCDNIEIYKKKEIVISMIRSDRIPEIEKGSAIPFKRINQGIVDLLKLHPFPRYCGPFTQLITGNWTPIWEPIMNSDDGDKKFQFFVSFTHSASQACGTWTFDDTEMPAKIRPLFKVDSEKTKLSGPASTLCHTIIYPCEYGGCCVQCPCNICTSGNEPCGQYCAKSPCEECDQQCPEHKCELDRTYSRKDSFTIPFYSQHLDKEQSAETIRDLQGQFRYSKYDPEDTFIKYVGIPRSCTRCQDDLLDHEVHHSVLHYRCKFCRKFLKLLRNNPVNSIQMLKEKKKREIEDGTTCAYCYKYFANSTTRKSHERVEHIVHEKPFECIQCSRSFASLVGLKHHQRKHTDTPKEYACETCQQMFTAERTLKRHIESVHGSQGRLNCDMCDTLFTRADNLTRHIHEAHSEPSVNTEYSRQLASPFECDHCG